MCRPLSQLGPSGEFRSDANPPSTTKLDAGTETKADAPSVTMLDATAETEIDNAPTPRTDAATDLYAETETDVAVDVVVLPGTDANPDAAVGLQPDIAADAPADASIGTDAATSLSTGLPTTTESQTSTGSQTETGAGTPTDITTVSGTDSWTGTGSQTATVFSGATATGTSSQVGSWKLTASETATSTSILTSTNTPSVTGSQTAIATATLTSTGTPASTSSQIASHTSTFTGTGAPGSTNTVSGSATGTQTATTTAPVAVTSVALDKTTDQISTGNTDRLTASILPANATNRAVTWSASNASVATVSSSGLVSAVAAGTAIITVTTVDGGKTATCAVTVVVSVTGVSLSISTATIGLGQTVSLTTTVVPANATNQSLTWSSSKAAVATVSATGAAAVVTAVASGSATITVSTQDGNRSATCVVTVAMSAQWVRTPTSGSSWSTFASMAMDSAGNVYVAGTISGTDLYTFGNSVSAVGPSTANNAVLVKYDANGTAQWARTVATGSGVSAFTGLAVDGSGNLFAVGTISGNGSYDFGNGVVAAGAYAFGSNLVLVKYDASGTTQWMRTVTDGMGATSYAAVALDPSGNLYAAGAISDSSPYDLGYGTTVTGIIASGKNALLVKYNPAGTTQWARSMRSGSGESSFAGVAVSGAGNVYLAGRLTGTLAFGFGNGVTATGTGSLNALLVQYNAAGLAQWARTAGSGGNNSDYAAVAVDNASGVLVAGSIFGNTANDFGGGVKVAGAYAAGSSVLLLKYDPSGAAQWGQSLASATGLSRLSSLALDSAGHIYAAGLLAGPGSYDFGNSVGATATSNGNEILLTKYDSAGICQLAQTAATGSSISGFSAVAADGAANTYAAGYINGTNPVDFGNSMTAIGAYSGGYNAVLVKYR